jgi:rhombotail lipoprotein
MRKHLFLIILVMLMGCTPSSFNRASMKHSLYNQPKEGLDEEIRQTIQAKQQIKTPFKLGIFFDSEVPSREMSLGLNFWEHKDKLLFISRIQDLNKEEIVSETVIIPDLIISGNDPTSIRLAAAKENVDAVLIIKGIDAIDTYANPFAILYFTIIGMGIFPGSHQDALVILSSALWDVKSGYLYFTGESEGEDKIIRPLFFLHERPALERAKIDALNKLFEEFYQKMKNINVKK